MRGISPPLGDAVGRAVDRMAVGVGGLPVDQEDVLLVLLLSNVLQFVLGVGTVILGNVGEHVAVRDANDEEQPKEVESLERGQQGGGDVLADPALVLLCLPVELEGADGPELGEQRPEDAQVEVVAQVNPGEHEKPKVGPDEPVVDVVEGLGGLEKRSRVSTPVAIKGTLRNLPLSFSVWRRITI